MVRMRRSRACARGLDDGDPCDRLLGCRVPGDSKVTAGDTRRMAPLPGTIYGPEGWEEADLDDWLEGTVPEK